MTGDELIDRLEDECAEYASRLHRVENENIALATANSELRTEVKQLKALLRAVTHD